MTKRRISINAFTFINDAETIWIQISQNSLESFERIWKSNKVSIVWLQIFKPVSLWLKDFIHLICNQFFSLVSIWQEEDMLSNSIFFVYVFWASYKQDRYIRILTNSLHSINTNLCIQLCRLTLYTCGNSKYE